MKGFTGKSLIAGIGALALALGASFAVVSAQQPAEGQPSAPGMRMHRGPGGPFGPWAGRRGPIAPMRFMLRQLDLTEAQRGQVKAIFDGHKADFEAVATRMRDARKGLQAAMQATPVNETAIREASAAVAAITADAHVLRANVRAEVLNVLTDEQKARAAEIKAKGEARRAVQRERRIERQKARQAQRPQGEF